MHVALTDELQKLIEKRLASGEYATAQDVVAAALRSLEQRDQVRPTDTASWVKSLDAWAQSHGPVGHRIDDSRDGIYSGTADDPR